MLIELLVVYGGCFGPLVGGIIIGSTLRPHRVPMFVASMLGILVSMIWIVSIVFFGLRDRIQNWCTKRRDGWLRALGIDIDDPR